MRLYWRSHWPVLRDYGFIEEELEMTTIGIVLLTIVAELVVIYVKAPRRRRSVAASGARL